MERIEGKDSWTFKSLYWEEVAEFDELYQYKELQFDEDMPDFAMQPCMAFIDVPEEQRGWDFRWEVKSETFVKLAGRDDAIRIEGGLAWAEFSPEIQPAPAKKPKIESQDYLRQASADG